MFINTTFIGQKKSQWGKNKSDRVNHLLQPGSFLAFIIIITFICQKNSQRGRNFRDCPISFTSQLEYSLTRTKLAKETAIVFHNGGVPFRDERDFMSDQWTGRGRETELSHIFEGECFTKILRDLSITNSLSLCLSLSLTFSLSLSLSLSFCLSLSFSPPLYSLLFICLLFLSL